MTTEQVLEDALVATALSVDGVAAMHAGEFGEVGTHLPGRKIVGIRVSEDVCDVHITVAYPSDVHAVARAVHVALEPLVDMPVSVTVEDVIIEGART